MSIFCQKYRLLTHFSHRIFDKDDDGLISVEELRHIMLSFGEKMSEKELDEMIAEANCDKDGHIDYEGKLFEKQICFGAKNSSIQILAQFSPVVNN